MTDSEPMKAVLSERSFSDPASDGNLRQPRYRRRRDDKPVPEVLPEVPS